jgi:hypothetical protein
MLGIAPHPLHPVCINSKQMQFCVLNYDGQFFGHYIASAAILGSDHGGELNLSIAIVNFSLSSVVL